jgi:hypothetical protein
MQTTPVFSPGLVWLFSNKEFNHYFVILIHLVFELYISQLLVGIDNL